MDCARQHPAARPLHLGGHHAALQSRTDSQAAAQHFAHGRLFVGLSHERSDYRRNAITPPSPTFTAWHLDGGAIDDWDGWSTWIELMTDFPNRIIHILRGCPNGLTSKDIAERLGTTRRNLSSRLSKLAAYGIIGRVRGTVADHGTKGAIYRAPCNAAQDGRI
jgi:CRP-like cAMP-binding protein